MIHNYLSHLLFDIVMKAINSLPRKVYADIQKHCSPCACAHGHTRARACTHTHHFK